MFKVHRTIQEQFKVFSKCLFINPAGGTPPSGSRVQRKIYCLGSILNISKFIFTPLKCYAQNYKDRNVCPRHARETYPNWNMGFKHGIQLKSAFITLH